MIIGEVGDYEAEDIRNTVEKVLRDLGYPEPPINLKQVRALFDLDLRYYSSSDTGFLQEMTHRMKVAGKQILEQPMLLWEVVKKANLSAVWIPNTKRILIDENVPKPKHRWIESHEIGHSLIPWHKEFLFGDNDQTLDPTCHAIVEAEANYAASRLLFMQDRFAAEARDCNLDFKTVQQMGKRYGNTLTSTFWRMIEDRDPDRPVFGMMTAHPNYDIGRGENGEEIRYLIRSKAFKLQFSSVTPEQGYALIKKHITNRYRGPVFQVTDTFANDRDEHCEFEIESFCNQHSLLTIGAMTKLKPIIV